MSKLELALERFNAAIDRIESSAVSSAGEAERVAAAATSRIESLEQERERLLARIAELEEDTQTLSGLTEEVEHRLDGAIAEIRTALGR